MNNDPDDNIELMSTDRIRRTLKRMAHQVMESNRLDKDITLFGIKDRGYAVARQLSDYLEGLTSYSVQLYSLDMAEGESADMQWEKGKKPSSLEGRFVLVVDDVIFTGSTMFKALQVLQRAFQPEELHTATLVDRGHRKFPVTAEFSGMDLPTKLDEHVTVHVEKENLTKVVLSPSFH